VTSPTSSPAHQVKKGRTSKKKKKSALAGGGGSVEGEEIASTGMEHSDTSIKMWVWHVGGVL